MRLEERSVNWTTETDICGRKLDCLILPHRAYLLYRRYRL